MRSVAVTVQNLALGLGIIGAVGGFAVHGSEGGILWALVGYFLGKAIQSTVWTLTAPTS